jgi:hypothetical protein
VSARRVALVGAVATRCMFFGVERLFYWSLGDSAWTYSFVIGLPLIAAAGYGFFGRRSSQ